MCTTCMPSAYWVSEEGDKSPENRVTDGCEPWCESWESNRGPLPEQQELWTTESSLQPGCHHWSKKAYDPFDKKQHVYVYVYLLCHLCIYMFNMHGGFSVTSGNGEATSRGQHVPLYREAVTSYQWLYLITPPLPHLIKRQVIKHLMKRTPVRTWKALTYSVPERTQSLWLSFVLSLQDPAMGLRPARLL